MDKTALFHQVYETYGEALYRFCLLQMKNAADQADVVVCVGWEFYNVETIAPDYPEVNWIWVDNATSAPVSNVLNITYAQNEGSFLAGYVAGKITCWFHSSLSLTLVLRSFSFILLQFSFNCKRFFLWEAQQVPFGEFSSSSFIHL